METQRIPTGNYAETRKTLDALMLVPIEERNRDWDERITPPLRRMIEIAAAHFKISTALEARDDLVSEIYLILLVRLRTHTPKYSITQYVYRAVRNKLYDWNKEQKHRVLYLDKGLSEDLVEDLLVDTSSPDDFEWERLMRFMRQFERRPGDIDLILHHYDTFATEAAPMEDKNRIYRAMLRYKQNAHKFYESP